MLRGSMRGIWGDDGVVVFLFFIILVVVIICIKIHRTLHLPPKRFSFIVC